MITDKEKLLRVELRRRLVSLRKSAEVLSDVVNHCRDIGIKDEYSFIEHEAYDALTSRFARTLDLLTQKVFGLFDALDFEEHGTFIDRLNRAEKRGIIDGITHFKEMKELRNQIVYEYLDENLDKLHEKIMSLSPVLLEAVNSAIRYSTGYKEIQTD